MKYFNFNIGDYVTDTMELSLAEHGVYLKLLLHMYATESPLPGDKKELYRITRAHSRQDRAALWSVIDQFFTAVIVDENNQTVEKRSKNGRKTCCRMVEKRALLRTR